MRDWKEHDNMDLQQQIDILCATTNKFCKDFQEALEKLSDEINDACASMQEAREELKKYAYDCVEEERKKASQRKVWRTENKSLSKPLLVDKRPKIYNCRNAC